jgi:hypothetical protein
MQLETRSLQKPIISQGHLSTKSWAMIVQAQEHKISAYIVPVDHILGFNPERETFEPHLEMVATDHEALTKWMIDGTVIEPAMLSTVSKKLFAALIRVMNGRGTINDKFELNPKESAPKSEPDLPPRPGYNEELDFLTANTLPQERSDVTTSTLGASLTPTHLSDGGSASMSSELDRSTKTVESAFDTFILLLNQELDFISTLTVKAMATQDIICLQRMIKQKAAAESFRQQVAVCFDKWKAASAQ